MKYKLINLFTYLLFNEFVSLSKKTIVMLQFWGQLNANCKMYTIIIMLRENAILKC
jgi:hypothetical protein